MIECPNCGGTDITTTIEHEKIGWGGAGETFECDTPVRHCKCGVSWIDDWGQKTMTLAQFKFEKSKGINRVKFASEDERKLWEYA